MNVTTLALFIVGLALLVGGGEMLVRGAARISAAAGISPLIIGLTVVAFGTSSPELAVSVKSSLANQMDIVLGNVIGSNIFNVLFILGLSALITPLFVSQQLVRWDVPIMICVSVLVLLMGLDRKISRLEGILLFAGIIIYTLFSIYQSRKEDRAIQEEYAKEYGNGRGKSARHWIINLGFVAGGLALLVLGSHWLVNSAVIIAQAVGVSELIIGLTIVAAGTSLPEVATSVIASFRGERDIAVGNVVGSNIFNILAVLGLSSIVAPEGINVSSAAVRFDIPVMITVAIACLPIFFTGSAIVRWEGMLFLGYYVSYLVYLILKSTWHDTLPVFSTVMLAFIIPITVVTLITVTLRSIRENRKNAAAGEGDAGLSK